MKKLEVSRVSFLNSADRSDPENDIVVIGAKFFVDGVAYAARGEARRDKQDGYPRRFEEVIEEAIRELLLQVLDGGINDNGQRRFDAPIFVTPAA